MEIFGYIAAGSLMKLTDELSDGRPGVNVYEWTSIFSGMAYGLVIGLLISHSLTSVYVFGGIIIGCLIAGKIDARGHYLALASTLLIFFTLGFESANPPILLLIALSSAVDEINNDRYKSFKNKAVKLFFRHRMTMKVLLLTFSIFNILSYYSIIYLLIFDLSYHLTEAILRR